MTFITRSKTNLATRGPYLKQTRNGVPVNGVNDFFMFTEGTGTLVNNIADSAVDSTIEQGLNASGVHTWLAGGGIQMSYTKQIKGQALDFTLPWTVACAGSIHCVAGAGNYFVTIMSVGPFGASLRGCVNYCLMAAALVDGQPNDINARAASNGGLAATIIAINNIGMGTRRVFSMRHFGGGNITTAVHDADGPMLGTNEMQVDLNAATTITGVQQKMLQPTLGGDFNQTLTRGFGRWEYFVAAPRAFDQADMTLLCSAAKAIGSSRGRPFD